MSKEKTSNESLVGFCLSNPQITEVFAIISSILLLLILSLGPCVCLRLVNKVLARYALDFNRQLNSFEREHLQELYQVLTLLFEDKLTPQPRGGGVVGTPLETPRFPERLDPNYRLKLRLREEAHRFRSQQN
jgi:hypothetical protein